MRLIAIVLGVLAVVPAVALPAPTASAFAWCADVVPGNECWSHFACVGVSRDYRTHREWCQYGIGDMWAAALPLP